MTRRSALVLLLAALAIATLAAGCGSGAGSGASGASGAKRGGTVTLLTHDSFAASPEVLADFTARTGYTVRLLQPGDAGVVVNEAILRRDRPVADALYGIDNTELTRAFAARLFAPGTAPDPDLVPGTPTDPQRRVVAVDRGDVCVVYDRTWFGRDGRPPAPRSFADLADPRYRGLTVVEDAAASSPGFVFLAATVAEFGTDGWPGYWRDLRANDVRVVDGWTQAYLQDFTAGGGPGDRPIVISYGSSPPADVVGASSPRAEPRVAVIEPTCFRQTEFAGVLAGAARPDAGKALVDFLVSRRFQADLPLQMYVSPVVAGVPVPAVYARWAVVPADPLTLPDAEIAADRDAWIRRWTDIVVR